ncbi:MAG: murein biosynthesis integral membrane protein MurJ [Thermodesulfobacteriota bacterium]
MSTDKNITRNWGLVGLLTFFSRLIGYIRDVIVAYYFGASYQTDAFYVAFRIPNLLRRLFAEGSITVAFVPIFTEYLKQGQQEARNALNSIFTTLFLIVFVVSILGVVFSPVIVKLFAYGFDEKTFLLAVELNRIMFPYILFISLAALSMGILNSIKHFFAPAFSPVLFNLVIIGCIVLFYGLFERPIVSLAIGVIIGGVLQFAINIPFLIKNGYLFRFTEKIKHPAVKGIALLMTPQLFGLAVYNLNILVNTQYASFMPNGTITYLYFSERLIEFPLGIIAVSIATVMLPKLSAEAADNRMDVFKKDYMFSLRLMLFILIPSLAGLIALRSPLCSVLFERGEFTAAEVVQTAQAVLGYSLGLWAIGGLRITVPAFYALKDTRTPVIIAFVAFIVNIILGYILGLHLSLHQFGLALASSVSATVNFVLLIYLLNKRTANLISDDFINFIFKVIIFSGLMGLITWKLSRYVNWSDNQSYINIVYLAGIILFSFVIYFGLSKIFKINEVNDLKGILSRKG